MERVPISQIKNRLSAYLRKVRAGETVIILDRNAPVAKLEAIRADNVSDAQLIKLERSGSVRRPEGPLSTDILRSPMPRSRRSVVDALLEERRRDR